ncbi:MAG: aminoacyl-tRNA hydrolase [Lachnospiraceae bacterium]|nr:aminoacyl-tRNA hydrolase [Lachnospiraceae bacterium]
MMIIVGLGNPKREYIGTRHNIGFMAIDELARKHQIDVIESKHKALIGRGYIGGQKVILAKPVTFMNLSGESVRSLVDYYKIDEKSELIVLYDDISLEPGRIRLRKKGSAGGHNGIKNIIAHLGHDSFLRIKIGVGEKPKDYDLADYVLGHFGKEEKPVMEDALKRAADAVDVILSDGIEKAMNQYN